MHRLKLVKARSYTRGYITATADKPYVEVESMETVKALLESGYFQYVGNLDAPETVTEPAQAEKEPEITEAAEDAPEITETATVNETPEDAEPARTEETPEDSGETLRGHFARAELETWEDGVLRKLAADMEIADAGILDREALLDAICATEVEVEPQPDYDALAKMSKAELIAFAKEREIDVSKCRTKSDILEEISIAYGGSPTMIDLQREAGTQGGDTQ